MHQILAAGSDKMAGDPGSQAVQIAKNMLHLANICIRTVGEAKSCPSNTSGRACYIVNLDIRNTAG